jgi:hypothetical protein
MNCHVVPVGHVRIDSGEVHIVPKERDAEFSALRDGQSVYAHPAAPEQPAQGLELPPLPPPMPDYPEPGEPTFTAAQMRDYAIRAALASAPRVPQGMSLVPTWKLRRAAEVLDRDGDEHGVAADLWTLITAPQPEGDTP